MKANTSQGGKQSAIATVDRLIHSDNFPSMRKKRFESLDGNRLNLDRSQNHLKGWSVGDILQLTAHGHKNLRSDVRRGQKFIVVGFDGNHAVIQIDGGRCFYEYINDILRCFEKIGTDEAIASDLNAVSIAFDDQKTEVPLPDFQVAPGERVLVNIRMMKITRKVEAGKALVISRARLNPRSMGDDGEKLNRDIKAMVIGQDQAIAPILSAYQKHRANLLDDSRPAASILMLGPTGSGKTRTAEALAECLLGDRRAMVKIDCAEFQHSHEIAKLIGSPPGYLGHRETHPLLTQESLDQHHKNGVKLTILLFDEIEKASDALWKILLGILDKATLTLGDNRRVDFSNCMILCTSNLAADEIMKLAEIGQKLLREGKSIDRTKLAQDVESVGLTAARSVFSPEFVNRFDKIVSYVPLMEAELMRILDIELGYVQKRVEERHKFTFQVADSAKKFLLEKGTDMRYGARELKRTIEQYLTHPLANLIVSKQVEQYDTLDVLVDGNNDSEYPLVFEIMREQLADRAAAND